MNKSIQGLSDDVVDGFHLWTPEELQEEFKGYEDAVSRTTEVADRCNVEINLEETYLPQFVVPEQFADQDDYLRFISREGLSARIEALQEMAIDLDEIQNKAGKLFNDIESGNRSLDFNLPPRPPGVCTGCPERPVFTAIKMLKEYRLGDKSAYYYISQKPCRDW